MYIINHKKPNGSNKIHGKNLILIKFIHANLSIKNLYP